MSKQFASVADLEEKKLTFSQLSEHCYAFTAEGDPNTGVIIGDDSVMIIDATATPVAAQSVIAKVREITDKPIKYVTLTHYHAVRVLGASGYRDAGLQQIIASQRTQELIVERGQQDMDSEITRFPRLFESVESIPGLTWPTLIFDERMTLMMGDLKVEIWNPGRGHTQGGYGTRDAATPRATPWSGSSRRRYYSPATWSNSKPPATPATPISATGRRRWTQSKR
jgi:glyoxylase-like metal-dependent hydrolase (beta-lactamase superfamily II)